MFAIITGINQSLSSAIISDTGIIQNVRIAAIHGSNLVNHLWTKKDNGIFVRREKKLKWRASNFISL